MEVLYQEKQIFHKDECNLIQKINFIMIQQIYMIKIEHEEFNDDAFW